MDKRERNGIPPVGGSSLLVIFAVMCLTVFALLCLTTVQAYGRLADASVQAVADYYAADCAAETIFARLRNGELPESVEKMDGRYAYTCRISKTQELQVELMQSGMEWSVIRWQAVSTAEESQEETLLVWKGE